MTTSYFTKRYLQIFFRSASSASVLFFHARKKLQRLPRSIVVVQTAQLGDMVCTTPVFRAIKKHLPEVRLTVVGSRAGAGILENNPDVDEYVVFNERNPGTTARVLRAAKIDVGINIVPSLDCMLLLAETRIPFIVSPKLVGGWSPSNTWLYRFLCRFVVTEPHHFGAYAPLEYLRLLEPLGIKEEDTVKHLAYTSEAQKNVDELLVQAGVGVGNSFVCMAPGAGNKIKQWPPERFASVAEYIWNTFHLPIIILGSAVDEEEVEKMREALPKEVHYIDTCSKLSLDEAKALISRARLLIAADTMVIYIAEAFTVPLIDIVGPVGPNEQPPCSEHSILVLPPGDYTPQLHIMNARVYDAEEARRQVMSTTVAMVNAAVDSLLRV